MFSKTNIFIIAGIATVLIIVFIGRYLNVKNESTPKIPEPSKSFPTQQECEQTTKKQCGFKTCDFIPKGKTYEEVCGKDFRKGWVPIN
ncbi:MAG: hypothetical protein AAB772_03215 [Patescibacteria group bacterium]